MATLRLVPASGSPIEIIQDQVLLGRDPGCDFVLNDGSVSRRHARIERRGSTWAVVDQGSANGTFLDSHRVSDAVLRTGQDLRFGSVSYGVEIEGEIDMGATIGGSPDATVVQPAAPAAAPPPPRPVAPPPPPRPAPSPPAPSAPPPPPPPQRPAARLEPLSPVPAMNAGAPPPRKGRGPFFWLVTGCFGCLTMIVLLAALIGGGLYMWTRGPIDSVKAELGDIRQGKLDAAYARLSEEYKARLPRDDFARAIAGHPGLKDDTDGHFWSWSVRVVNDKGRVTGRIGAGSGQPEPAVFRLAKESGEWKISSIELGGTDLTGADAAPEDPAFESSP